MNNGDTAWLLVSAALVMVMTPALAMFYGGMVRRKNILGTIMQSFIVIALISVEWMLVGYSAAFGPDLGGVIGDLSWFGLAGVGVEPFKGYAATVPHQAFMIYQMMFAVITPALIAGAFAERFTLLHVPGLLPAVVPAGLQPRRALDVGDRRVAPELGAIDFAGGTVVHITAGVSALAAALVVGKRKGFSSGENMAPHNLPMTVLGTRVALVRLVRLQRRQRARRGRTLRARLRLDPHGGRRRHAHLDVHRVGATAASRPSSAPPPGASRGWEPSPRRRGSCNRLPPC